MEIPFADWREPLNKLGMLDFETIWNLQLDRIDEKNIARGGWSEVVRFNLQEPVLATSELYIKRQSNYGYRAFPNIFKVRPTLFREFSNLMWCIDNDVPVIKPLLFAVEKVNGESRAILITAGLTDYWSLDKIDHIAKTREQRLAVIQSVAEIIFDMHIKGLQHSCLYPKHVYVSNDFFSDTNRDIRLLDLEKARPISLFNEGIFRDLDSFMRRAVFLGAEERQIFFDAYYQWPDKGGARLFEKLERSRREWKDA